MLLHIQVNVFKRFGECCQTFRGMSSSMCGNVAKYSGKCDQSFWRVPSDIPGNVCVTQGDEDDGSVQDFMEFVVQPIAWNL